MRELSQERNVASFVPQSGSAAGPELLALSLCLFLPERTGVAVFTASVRALAVVKALPNTGPKYCNRGTQLMVTCKNIISSLFMEFVA